jgi:hypothetical protein
VGEIALFDLRLPVVTDDDAQQLDRYYLKGERYCAPHGGLQERAAMGGCTVDNARIAPLSATAAATLPDRISLISSDGVKRT